MNPPIEKDALKTLLVTKGPITQVEADALKRDNNEARKLTTPIEKQL